MEGHPRVLISHAHESNEHAKQVGLLADCLTTDGIDIFFDQYDPHPKQGWQMWMTEAISQSEFVLMVCSPKYYQRVMQLLTSGRGTGGSVGGKADLGRPLQ
jgi:hypothetical protein